MSKALINDQIHVLEQCQVAWETYAKSSSIEDFGQHGAPGVTKAGLSKAFALIIEQLKSFDFDDNPFLTNVLVVNLSSWVSPILAWIQSLSASPSIAGNIFSHLNAIASQFNAYSSFSEKELTPKQIAKLSSEQTRLMEQVKKLKSELTELLTKRTLLNEAFESAENIKDIKVAAEADASISGAHRESIESSKVEAEKYLKLISEASDSFPEYEEQGKKLLNSSNEVFQEALNRLDFASRAGLAVSFQDRAKKYVWPSVGWFSLFLFSLVGIVGVGYYFVILQGSATLLPNIVAVKDSASLSFNSNDNNYTKVISSLKFIPLSLPFIWLAWFSALKFSQLGRLREDYAFKVATALALDGYRKQAAEVSPELAVKLLDLAITNFGENPLRLLTKESAKDAHPLAGIIDEKGWGEVFKEGLQSIANKVGK